MLEVQAESVRENDIFPSIFQLHQIGMNKKCSDQLKLLRCFSR